MHQKLDSPLDDLDLDADFDHEFKDHWAKTLPFQFEVHTTNRHLTMLCVIVLLFGMAVSTRRLYHLIITLQY